MKHNAYAILIAGTLLAVAAAQGSTVAYWNFEDGVNGQPFYVDGGANDGSYDTIAGILMRGYDSNVGPSFSSDNLYYNGLCMRTADKRQDGFLLESALQSWAPTNWTIECTVRLDQLDGWNTFIGRDGTSFGEAASDFYLQNTISNNFFRLNYMTAGGQRIIIDATNIVARPRQWYGLAAVSDGTTVSLYIDDRDGKGYELEGAAALTNAVPGENALTGSVFLWTFGRGWYGGNYVNHINGAMDNIRFSDTALAPDELIPVPDDPFLITHAPAVVASGISQTIDVMLVNEGSELKSAELYLDGMSVAANNTPSGVTNSVSYAAEELYAGTHSAMVLAEGINPSVTVTQRWDFTIAQAPVESMTDGAVPGKWTMDIEAAKQVAAEKRLPILVDFSGSDWCSWCKLMEKDVFTKPAWREYAEEQLMMVLIDFPNDTSRVPEKYVERNQELKAQYRISGYPTYVILDVDGETELGRLGAGSNKTPASFLAELQELLHLSLSGIEAYADSLSPGDQTAYLALVNQLKATTQSKEQTQTKMTELQIKLTQLAQEEELLKDDIRFFRVAMQLDTDERKTFEELTVKLREAKQTLIDWLGSNPEQNEYNIKLYQEMYSLLQELEEELAQYDDQ